MQRAIQQQSFGGVPQSVGKIHQETFARSIAPRLGAGRREVLVGPRHGMDVGVVDLGGDRVMVITTDPLFVAPEYGWERAAWFAIHIAASDAATSGLPPMYCTIDLNLPVSMTDIELDAMWESMHLTCRDLGMAIVTGHTGRYEGCNFPMLGGITVVSLGSKESYVTPAMAQPGDTVIITKGAAIETTAIFGVMLGNTISAAHGSGTAEAAADLFTQMSVVRDAGIATGVGTRDRGVTAMHDATERGVWGGLSELAEASDVGLAIDHNAIIVRPETHAVCDLFSIDPFSASSEGTLLVTCRPEVTDEVQGRLDDSGIAAALVGEVVPREEGLRVYQDGRASDLRMPAEDPFWPALQRALAMEGR